MLIYLIANNLLSQNQPRMKTEYI